MKKTPHKNTKIKKTSSRVPKTTLRKLAETKMKERHGRPDEMFYKDPDTLIHELEVHQVELEMQNEELRNAQVLLEESRSRYVDLYDFAPVGYFTLNKNGLILEVNLTGASQLGMERASLIKKPLTRFIHKEFQDVFYMHRREAAKIKATHSCELRLEQKDGSEFYAKFVSMAFYDAQDNFEQMRTSVVDINESRKLSEELRREKNLSELLLDTLPHPAMLIRKDRVIIAANRIAREVGARVNGYCWQDFGHGDYISDADKKYIAKYKKIPSCGTHCFFCKADISLQEQGPKNTEVNSFGRLWDTYWIPLDKEVFLHYAMDITERKKAEEMIFDLSKFPAEDPNPVLRLNKKGEILYKNEAVDKLLKKEGLSEKDLLKIMPRNLNRQILSSLKTGTAYYGLEVAVGNKIYSYSMAPVVENQYVNIYASDITESKRVEQELFNASLEIDRWNKKLEHRVIEKTEELKESQEQLIQSEKLSSMGRLAAGLAHELNSPLAGLLPMLEKFRAGAAEGSGEYKELQLMLNAAEHMANIVKDFSSFSRKSTGEFAEIDIEDAIEAILSLSKDRIKQKEIHITREYGDDIPKVMGNRTELQQVVLNIVSNACDAMDKGGGLIIRTGAANGGKRVIIEIIDNGAGIDKELISKIFDPFFTTKSPGKGTGLGLSVSYGIIKNHKGTITVRSEPGKGTEFSISLPAVKVK